MAQPDVTSRMAQALWFTAPRTAELIAEELRRPGPSEILVESGVSLISAGTEMVMYRGDAVSELEADLPTAAGSFPFPLKYAYQVVGRVADAGEASGFAIGDTVFAYHPHQDAFVIPVRAGGGPFGAHAWPLVFRVPLDLPEEKAVFGNLFCVALNAVLDVPIRVGDRVVVSGLGVVGSFCAYLARLTAGRLILVDPIPERRARAAWIGADAVVDPSEASAAIREYTDGVGADVYIEASGAPAALQSAVAETGQEGTIAVVSYYGNKAVPLVLSPEFHLRRHRVVSAMVGQIGSGLQPRWTLERRMAVAMSRLADCPTTNLVTHRIDFGDAAGAYRLIDSVPEQALAVLLEYADAGRLG